MGQHANPSNPLHRYTASPTAAQPPAPRIRARGKPLGGSGLVRGVWSGPGAVRPSHRLYRRIRGQPAPAPNPLRYQLPHLRNPEDDHAHHDGRPEHQPQPPQSRRGIRVHRVPLFVRLSVAVVSRCRRMIFVRFPFPPIVFLRILQFRL